MLVKNLIVIIILPLTTYTLVYSQTTDDSTDIKNRKYYEIKFVGDATIFSLESLYSTVDAFKSWLKIDQSAPLDMNQLIQLKDAINKKYHSAGYINSKVIIESINEKRHLCQFRVIECKLTRVIVSNNKYMSTTYISNFFFHKTGKSPLNIKQLEEQAKLLRETPGIQNIEARLENGLRAGEASLRVKVYESYPFQLSAIYNNFGTEGTGKYRSLFYAGYTNLIGCADTLTGQYGLSKGTSFYSSSYSFPVYYSNIYCNLGAGKTFSRVITGYAMEHGDILHNSKNVFVDLRYLIYKSIRRKNNKDIHIDTTIGASGELQKNELQLLNRYMRFGSELQIVKFFCEFIYREMSQIFYIKSNLNMPLQTKNEGLSNIDTKKFHHFRTDMKYQKRFFRLPVTLEYQLQLNLADTALPGSEKSTIGGVSGVRGYRENFLNRDCSVISRFECLMTLFSFYADIFKKTNHFELRLSSFYDYGQGWNMDTDHNQYFSDLLMSIGIGLKFNLGKSLSTVFYWGYPLTEPEKNHEKMVNDNQVHFYIKTQFY